MLPLNITVIFYVLLTLCYETRPHARGFSTIQHISQSVPDCWDRKGKRNTFIPSTCCSYDAEDEHPHRPPGRRREGQLRLTIEVTLTHLLLISPASYLHGTPHLHFP